MRRLAPIGATLGTLLMLMALPACGGGSSAQPAGSTKVTFSDFKFDPKSISVSGGKVVLYLVNSGSTGHDFVITKDAAGKEVVSKSSLVAAGDTSAFTVDNIAPGSYFFRCDVPGHADSGMTGTLSVK